MSGCHCRSRYTVGRTLALTAAAWADCRRRASPCTPAASHRPSALPRRTSRGLLGERPAGPGRRMFATPRQRERPARPIRRGSEENLCPNPEQVAGIPGRTVGGGHRVAEEDVLPVEVDLDELV